MTLGDCRHVCFFRWFRLIWWPCFHQYGLRQTRRRYVTSLKWYKIKISLYEKYLFSKLLLISQSEEKLGYGQIRGEFNVIPMQIVEFYFFKLKFV